MQSHRSEIILNIVVSLVLIYRFGLAGLSLERQYLCLSRRRSYVFVPPQDGYEVGRLLRESYVKPVICSLVLLGAGVAIRPEKDSSWTGLFAGGLAFGVVYVVTLLFSRFFDRFDWDKVESFVPCCDTRGGLFQLLNHAAGISRF